ncbi:amidohydrolase [Neobacillus drentensis]|uniref:amidohydrolase n=1 Tax=Neobacillus drentensis TaxID=220684 RepID=UPI001F3A9010|nr:amidohydrolase [Neobacillus drentensis]ULT57284.1 amidohydrolase [Neobacillus drentensis]
MNPLDFIEQHKDDLLNTYQELHGLAEPSWKEEKTSGYIAEKLQAAGFQVKKYCGHYGLMAEIPGTSDQVLALRADMDALVQEVNGVVKPNHSCGHDGHSTMVLYSALALAASGLKPKHTLRFIFQPAEEKGEGALKMMADGVLEKVSLLFGTHVRPVSELPYRKASPVIIHGSAGTIRGTIKGRQAHAARPNEGINVIETAALLVQKLKEIDLRTEVSYSVKMTQLTTESDATNVIPETAHFALDIRAQANDVMSELEKQTYRAMEIAAEKTGAVITLATEELVPAAAINEKAIKLAEKAIGEILGKERVAPVCISQGAEDFHFYTAKNPGLAATMIGLGCGLTPGLHHPEMKFNLDALIYGTKILTQTLLTALQET